MSQVVNKKLGFTLIELLVVISIISILIAILLPALSAARSTAQQIQCGSNMRQIAVAWSVYLAEHNDLLPYVNESNTPAPGQESIWVGLMGSYLGDSKLATFPQETNKWNLRITPEGILFCPSQQIAGIASSGYVGGAFPHYGMNSRIDSTGTSNPARLFKVTDITKPSQMAVFGETKHDSLANYGWYWLGAPLTGVDRTQTNWRLLHGGQDAMNMAFADGHVEIMQRDLLGTLSTPDSVSPPWLPFD